VEKAKAVAGLVYDVPVATLAAVAGEEAGEAVEALGVLWTRVGRWGVDMVAAGWHSIVVMSACRRLCFHGSGGCICSAYL